MGNAVSANASKKKKWEWEHKDGRLVPKYTKAQQQHRPLFKRQPSDDMDWWIGNPEPRRGGSGNLTKYKKKR